MKTWTIVNQKGGVGKTTTAVSLAGSLVNQGYKVLIVDLDPQGSLTVYLRVKQSATVGLYDYFLAPDDKNVSDLIAKTSIPKVDVIPGSKTLATLDREFGNAQGKGLVIKQLCRSLIGQYDYVLIDCPPVLGVLMVNGLTAADVIVIPTQTEFLALEGLKNMLSTLQLLQPLLNSQAKIKIIATMFDRRLKACQKAFLMLKEAHSEMLWRGYIPVDTKFRDASEKGQPINLLNPASRGSFAYDKLSNDLVNLSLKSL
ncbi:ParA family protein [Glaciecola sp. 1036]|uniref:ParA family protein n=1 Tax=Alteromonadaceae TaxID=72275 RepID=UPI003D06ECEF